MAFSPSIVKVKLTEEMDVAANAENDVSADRTAAEAKSLKLKCFIKMLLSLIYCKGSRHNKQYLLCAGHASILRLRRMYVLPQICHICMINNTKINS